MPSPRAPPRPRSAALAAEDVSSATATREPVRRSARPSPAAAPACFPSTSKRTVCGLTNLAIARILREIADLLELKNENPFKIRAYRNGADVVANHPHTFATLTANDLREIPGIGKDLAARIREIAETGGAEYHREL